MKSGYSESCTLDYNGNLKTIQLFYKGTKSKPFQINDNGTNVLNVEAKVATHPEQYNFFVNERFKIEGDKIIPYDKNAITSVKD